MASLLCPFCHGVLLPVPMHGRTSHVCPGHHGHALATSSVRSWLTDEARPNFDRALSGAKLGNRPCPRCLKPMNYFFLQANLQLDQCGTCGVTWFDRGEYERLPQRAAEEIESDDYPSLPLVEFQEGVSFRVGRSPYENVKGERNIIPVVTLLFIFAFLVTTKIAMKHEMDYFLFDSFHPLRNGGVPSFLSLFAHANMNHLIGNVCFFFLPGSLLEATLGEKVLVQVFFISSIAGTILQGFLDPDFWTLAF